MGRHVIDLIGRVFGKLVVISRCGLKHGGANYLCQCNCDYHTQVEVTSTDLRRVGEELRCLRRQLIPYKSQYLRFLSIAKRENIDILISYEDFLEYTKQQECHYCGEKVEWFRSGGKNRGYNLDRKDNSIGYLKSNIVVACNRCNRGKCHLYSYEEWVCMTAALRTMKLGKENRQFASVG